jgi:hypothetical protein
LWNPNFAQSVFILFVTRCFFHDPLFFFAWGHFCALYINDFHFMPNFKIWTNQPVCLQQLQHNQWLIFSSHLSISWRFTFSKVHNSHLGISTLMIMSHTRCVIMSCKVNKSPNVVNQSFPIYQRIIELSTQFFVFFLSPVVPVACQTNQESSDYILGLSNQTPDTKPVF